MVNCRNVYWAESYGQSVIYKQSVYETSNSKHEIWSTSLPIIALTFSKQGNSLSFSNAQSKQKGTKKKQQKTKNRITMKRYRANVPVSILYTL